MAERTPLENLLFRIADDELIIAHRNSEWTGLGPILEEDIAFSSIAQDKLGHAQAIYTMLHEMGHPDPDAIAFARDERDFLCCQLVELPIGGYDFSLVRHFLFDTAEALRFEMLESSSFEPLAKLARKVKGEIRYHVFHGNTWMEKLGRGTEESHARMQSALNEVFPYALGIFEPMEGDAQLAEQSVFAGEEELRRRWLETITPILERSGLTLPDVATVVPVYGGRRGFHTEYLAPLLEEMQEVFRIDPEAEW